MAWLVPALHLAATWFMCGVIWFVQVVHYPLFGSVTAEAFAAYERRNTRLTTLVVGPVMVVEALSALALTVGPLARGGAAPVVGLALLAGIWLSTFLLQVPAHAVLERGFDARAHRRLVRTNWIRTAAWTARGVVALLVTG
jgi:hypothetical protein